MSVLGYFLEVLLTCSSGGMVQLGALQNPLPEDPRTCPNT